ncbi:MAG: hypothetical protein ACRCTJ_04580 [Brevinema sp.]
MRFFHVFVLLLLGNSLFAQSHNWIDENKSVLKIINDLEKRRLSDNSIDPKSPEFSFQNAFDRFNSDREDAGFEEQKTPVLQDAKKWFYHLSLAYKNKEFLMVYPNAIIFKNSHGSYLFNVVFKKDLNFYKPKLEQELMVMVTPKRPLMPSYMFQTSIKITLVGEHSRSRWSTDFFYDHREINQQNTYTKKHLLKLFKSLDNTDLIRISDIFKYNSEISVVIEGLLGVFRFKLNQDQILFYNKFFEYAHKEGFYTKEVYYEEITR